MHDVMKMHSYRTLTTSLYYLWTSRKSSENYSVNLHQFVDIVNMPPTSMKSGELL